MQYLHLQRNVIFELFVLLVKESLHLKSVVIWRLNFIKRKNNEST